MRRARLRAAVNLSSAGRRRPPPVDPDSASVTPTQEKEPDDVGGEEGGRAVPAPVPSPGQAARRQSEKENERKSVDDDEPPRELPKDTEAIVQSPASPGGVRLKQRFKPNLAMDTTLRARLRKLSGSEAKGRVRTASASSDGGQGGKGVLSGITEIAGSPRPTGSPPYELSSPPPPLEETDPSQPRPSRPPSVDRWANLPVGRVEGKGIRSSMGDADSLLSGKGPAKIGRKRRLTETSATGAEIAKDPTVFVKRKQDHKKKFTEGVPERTKMTMFDLIYYNPESGARMSLDSSGPPSSGASRANSIDGRRNSVRTEEGDNRSEAADDPPPRDGPAGEEEEGEEEEDAMPAPQVKIGPDGSLVVDETSTVIDTTAAKKAKMDLLNSPLVFESSGKATNYGSWGKKRKNVDWPERETVRFFKALSVFGTDFSMMENVFKRRNRHDLKIKFKKEERNNRQLVDKCLAKGLKFDASFFDDESEQEGDEEEMMKRDKEEKQKKKMEERKRKTEERRKAKVKKRVRKVKSKRGYFSSSENEDDAATEKEPAGENAEGPRTRRRSLQQRNGSGDSPSTPAAPSSPASPAARSGGPLLKAMLTKTKERQSLTDVNRSPGFASFPPGLLAANPSLAHAAPGSLVVVASPSAGGVGQSASAQNQQLLHVFRVCDDRGSGDASQVTRRERKYSEAEAQKDHRTVKRRRTVSESVSGSKGPPAPASTDPRTNS